MKREKIYEVRIKDSETSSHLAYITESKELAESVSKLYSNYTYEEKLVPITNQDWLATLTPDEFILWLWGQGKGSLHELVAYNISRESCLREWLKEVHKDEA